MDKYRVFLGSSSKSKWFAHEIVSRLGSEVTMAPWFNPDSFPPSQATLEALSHTVAQCDFAILLLADDDLQQIGNQAVHTATRDNVLFELGLCYGFLDRDHVFFFYSSSAEFKLPSDLAGVTGYPMSFDQQLFKSDKGPIIAACSQIRNRLYQVADQDLARLQQARPRLELAAEFPSEDQVTEECHNHLVAGRFSDLVINVRVDDDSADDVFVYHDPRRMRLYHSAWTLRRDGRGAYYYWPPKNIPKGKDGRIVFEVGEPRPGEYRLSIVALAQKKPKYEKTFVITVDDLS